MCRIKRVNMVLFLLFFINVNLGLSQNVIDRIAAVVDDDIILQSEVLQGMQQIAIQMGIDLQKNPNEVEKLQKTTLENLIDLKILLIQAELDTIEANEQQVEASLQQQMQYITQQLGGQDKVEEYFKLPMSKIRRTNREQIEKNLRATTVRNNKMANIKVTRREVIEFFSTMKDSIGSRNEGVEISHILIQAHPGEASKKDAFEKISAIRDRILKGEDFAKLAKEYSEDPGSGAQGGDLGFMSRGDFVREFEEAVFNLEAGEVSDIVLTEYGYHVIRLEERRGEKVHCRHILISVKPSPDDEIVAVEKIKGIYQELLDGAKFEDLVVKYSDDESTKEAGGNLGYYEIDRLRETAKEMVFAIQDIKVGEFSEPVKTKFGFHIIKLVSRDQAREYSIEKDWDRIEMMATEYKKQKEYKKWMDELRQNVYIKVNDLAM